MADGDKEPTYIHLYACQCGDTACKEPKVYHDCCKAKGLRDKNLHPYHDEEVERLQRAWDNVWHQNKALAEEKRKLIVENQLLKGELKQAQESRRKHVWRWRKQPHLL